MKITTKGYIHEVEELVVHPVSTTYAGTKTQLGV